MIPYRDESRVPIFPFVVYGLVAVNVAVFISEIGQPTMGARDAFVDANALIPYDLTHGVQLAPGPPTLFTLITSQFVHASILHIVSNMLFLVVFGPEIEYLVGHFRFLGFYLLCGVLGNLAELAMMPGSHVPGIGASGAIAGVLGAYALRFPTNSIATIVPIGCFPLFLRLPAIFVIGLWAVTQFVQGFSPQATGMVAHAQQGGIAYFVHIGGFLAGVLLIGFFARAVPRRQGRRYRYYH